MSFQVILWKCKIILHLSFLLVKSECRYVFLFQRNQTDNQIYYCIMKENVLILIPWGIIIASFFVFLASSSFMFYFLHTINVSFSERKVVSCLYAELSKIHQYSSIIFQNRLQLLIKNCVVIERRNVKLSKWFHLLLLSGIITRACYNDCSQTHNCKHEWNSNPS